MEIVISLVGGCKSLLLLYIAMDFDEMEGFFPMKDYHPDMH